MSSSDYCFLTCIQVSQEAGQVVWYSHLFQNFPQFIVMCRCVGGIRWGTFRASKILLSGGHLLPRAGGGHWLYLRMCSCFYNSRMSTASSRWPTGLAHHCSGASAAGPQAVNCQWAAFSCPAQLLASTTVCPAHKQLTVSEPPLVVLLSYWSAPQCALPTSS